MSRIAVNRLANRLKTKEVATDDIVDSVAVTQNISTFVKSILDDGDVFEFRKSLGLTKQTSLNDTTADSVMTVGSFGLGGATPTLISDDLNKAVRVGFYCFPKTVLNNPVPANGGSLIVNSLGGNYVQQILQTVSSIQIPLMYIRHFDSTGNPGPWRKVYNESNIVGTVSQSATIPTGAIIENGANANGSYIKFADGTLICTSSNIAPVTPTIPLNNLATLYTQTMPTTFVGGFIGYASLGAFLSNDHYGVTNCYAASATTLGIVIRNGAATAQSFYIRYIAIGRWY